jgi:hypothetical protein
VHEPLPKGRHHWVGIVLNYFLLRGIFMTKAEETEIELERMKQARDSLLITNARLHGEIERLNKTPEDEEFERIEREQAMGWRKRQVLNLRTSVESFDDWEHSHRPEQYFVERRAYLAGFEAGRRYQQMKEIND